LDVAIVRGILVRLGTGAGVFHAIRSIGLSGLALSVLVLATGAGAPGLGEDAYHFSEFQDGLHDDAYAEWWYFNLVDPEQELRFVVGYAIFGPASEVGRAAVTALAFTEAGTSKVTESFSTSDFQASTVQPELTVGEANSIQTVDADTLRIAGSVEGEHAIAWSLTYLQRATPWLGSDGERVGALPWERMSWYNLMPGARVDGWIEIDGQSYSVTGASGYHDHNWGEWVPFEVVWNWAQYHEPGFSLGLGDFRNWPAGVVGIEVEGERVVFEQHQYLLAHTRWAWNAELGLPYPTESWLVASNGHVKLRVRMDVERSEALRPPPELPFPLLEPVIFEQTARFTGWLWIRTGLTWSLERSFQGEGFKEFTGRVPAN
jgi:hypothetical protein